MLFAASVQFILPDSRGGAMGLNLDLEVRQCSKGLVVGRHNIELFAVPLLSYGLVYAATPIFGMIWKAPVGFLWQRRFFFLFFGSAGH